MAQLKMGDTTIISNSSGTPTIQSGVTFPAGHILQVKQKKSDAFQEINANIPSMVNVSGLNESITISANSKVLVNVFLTFGSEQWGAHAILTRGINTSSRSVVDDAKGISSGNHTRVTAGSFAYQHTDETMQLNFTYLDSPAQSSSATIYYGINVGSRGTPNTITINVGHDYSDNSGYIARGISTMTLYEVKS